MTIQAYGAVLALALGLATASAAAQQTPTERGPVTNLPLPRFVSLKSDEGNARRGPSLSHRIDWVYKRRAMPLEVTAEYGHWRRVRDRDGAGGWVHYALLSGVRTVLVEEDMVALHAQPSAEAETLARAEAGVVARLGACTHDWCRISAGGARGWVPKTAIWGVGADELRD
ncbi:SH3 domain-containing protein [Tropicimonas sp. IMCC6043]|uniref:SH3 domain-containing protein n=1 Tax=Tropicimonas sp. IMCC6043 TaxID=2510645 RepID=UPI001F5C6D76|nr:SH3 domain-containing protein [Tropicimonas sp. IMCC6043]